MNPASSKFNVCLIATYTPLYPFLTPLWDANDTKKTAVVQGRCQKG